MSIVPSTYDDARRGLAEPSPPPGARRLAVEVARVHRDNYWVYGVRKVGAQLNREGIPVARCTVERLVGAEGLAEVRRGRRVRATAPADGQRASDLVRRGSQTRGVRRRSGAHP